MAQYSVTSMIDTRGFLITISSFIIWGTVPIFWKQISYIPAPEILSHRIIWTAVLLVLYMIWTKKLKNIKSLFLNPKQIALLFVSTLLISANWGIFVWAVNSGHIMETSMGYYINPLLNVFLGALLLGEKFNRQKKIAIFIAALGVLSMVYLYGSTPWIALLIALTFGFYGIIRKTMSTPADTGLTVESLLLFLPATLYLVYLSPSQNFTTSHLSAGMLILGGAVTTIPLLLYLEGVRRIPYSTVGIIQFLTPTCTFLIAVFIYNEPFSLRKLISFSLIWLAVLIYVFDIVVELKKNKKKMASSNF